MSERAGGGDSAAELNCLLEVGRLVASGGALSDVLNGIARQATEAAGGSSAGILWSRQDSECGWVFTVAGSWKLGELYRAITNNPSPHRVRKSGTGTTAIHRGQPVLIEDTETDPIYRPWRMVARQEGFRATASIPMLWEGEPLGVLEVHRRDAGPWAPAQVDLLASLALHAANAIRMATLLENYRQELAARSKLVSALRGQTHEHANRIHAISGLLALGEIEEAKAFASTLEEAQDQSYGEVVELVGCSALAGLLTADMLAGRQRGVLVRLNPRTRLHELPPRLSEAGALTVVGNLLQNAVEEVVSLPKDRRRVEVTLSQDEKRTVFRVRDWGKGIPLEQRAKILKPGFSTKRDHPGVGLALVADTVGAAGGRLAIRSVRPGTSITAMFDPVGPPI